MPYFKDSDKKLHFLEDESFVYLLPADCVKITDVAAKKLQVPTNDELALNIRMQRNELLQKSDYTQLVDVTVANALEWKVYRKALRDITTQPGFPTSINWPEPPK